LTALQLTEVADAIVKLVPKHSQYSSTERTNRLTKMLSTINQRAANKARAVSKLFAEASSGFVEAEIKLRGHLRGVKASHDPLLTACTALRHKLEDSFGGEEEEEEGKWSSTSTTPSSVGGKQMTFSREEVVSSKKCRAMMGALNDRHVLVKSLLAGARRESYYSRAEPDLTLHSQVQDCTPSDPSSLYSRRSPDDQLNSAVKMFWQDLTSTLHDQGTLTVHSLYTHYTSIHLLCTTKGACKGCSALSKARFSGGLGSCWRKRSWVSAQPTILRARGSCGSWKSRALIP
jgi:hypothetical protein